MCIYMYVHVHVHVGNVCIHWIPKLSASVKYSFARPDHCLVIFPTCWEASADKICKHGAEKTEMGRYGTHMTEYVTSIKSHHRVITNT